MIKVADGFGFHPSMVGFERLYKDGLLAVVHGCGYDHPSLSHFSSMGFWHTGVPNGGEPLGWLGRLADESYDAATRNVIVNLGNSQSLAVRSRAAFAARVRRSRPVPPRGNRRREAGARGAEPAAHQPRTRRSNFLPRRHRTRPRARTSFVRLRRRYRTPVDYGVGGGLGGNLQRVAALIAAEHADAALLRHLSGNSFDTHVQQADLHTRLLMYTADAVRGFMEDMNRLGAGERCGADDVHRIRQTRRGERR